MGDETVDGLEAKYVSGLSTIMVATIQEAKDRISQIEYIFCSQLYPNFQSKSKTLERVYSEREKTLLSQIEELKKENLALIKDKEKLSEQVVSMPLRLKSLEDYIVRLQLKLKNKSNELQNSVELHTRLVEVLHVEGSDELNKDEVNMILSKVKSLKVKADSLQEEVSKKALVTENLLKKVEYLEREGERKLSSLEEEKLRLTTRLQVFEENVDKLQELLRQKDDELKDGRMAIEVLQGKLDLTKRDEKEKLAVSGEEHRSYVAELEALHRLSEEKLSELAMEVKKRKEAHIAYKKLKSQYNFLCKRFGLTTDSVALQSNLEDNTNQTGPAISSSLESKHSETAQGGAAKVTSGTGKCEKESVIKTVQTPTSSISHIVRSPGVRSDAKSPQLSGLKRPASIWRDTRSRQSPGGHDPHDDFLDTPVENIKRVAGEEKQVRDAAAKKDDSDDETQEMNPKPSPSRQRIQVAEPSKKGFKHVEAVRKKAERENLKGIECKQCKKFYDAVLPENEGNGRSLRCEHHEGVSRHRYKYAPPMTPEGFWNIGFESEM